MRMLSFVVPEHVSQVGPVTGAESDIDYQAASNLQMFLIFHKSSDLPASIHRIFEK